VASDPRPEGFAVVYLNDGSHQQFGTGPGFYTHELVQCQVRVHDEVIPDGPLVYRISSGNQWVDIPWGNINRISVHNNPRENVDFARKTAPECFG
jgi:hypothetical protein